MKIYITGCARSGTTLLRRLFYSFKDVEIIGKEINISSFATYNSKQPVLVGKRTMNTIFSHSISNEVLKNQLALVDGIKIINIVRDGKDVIESGSSLPSRWMNSIETAKKYNDKIFATIYYELLVSRPDLIQKYITNLFGLEEVYRFSEYPDFIPKDSFDFEKQKPSYKLRKISTDRVNKKYDWKSKISEKSLDQFVNLNNYVVSKRQKFSERMEHESNFSCNL